MIKNNINKNEKIVVDSIKNNLDMSTGHPESYMEMQELSNFISLLKKYLYICEKDEKPNILKIINSCTNTGTKTGQMVFETYCLIMCLVNTLKTKSSRKDELITQSEKILEIYKY